RHAGVRGIIVEAPRPARTVSFLVEERLVHRECQRGQPHQRADELAHRAVVDGRRPLEVRRRRRPDVRREVPAALGARIVRVGADIDGSDAYYTRDRKSTRLNSSHEWISYAVFCMKKKNYEKSTESV